MATYETVAFTVTGEPRIHCSGCEQRIGNALRRLPGVREVRASAQDQEVVARIDTAQVSAAELRARLEQLGYAVARGRETSAGDA